MNPQRTYRGKRDPHGAAIVIVEYFDGFAMQVRALRHLERESAAGMDWGYFGSAVRDLAYSLLADHFFAKGDSMEVARKKAEDYTRPFALHVLNPLVHNRPWEMTTEYVDEMLRVRCTEEPEKAQVAL